MKKLLFFLIPFELCLLLHISFAHAISLSIIPSSQNVELGKSFDVAVVISGLGDKTAPSLGAFDLGVEASDPNDPFQPPIAIFSGDVVFGNQLDLFGLGSIRSVSGSRISEVSLDSPDDLNNLQAGTFTLATLKFNALAVGENQIFVSGPSTLADAEGNFLGVDFIDGSVTVAATPEPSTLLFVGSGLVGLAMMRRKRVR